MTTLITGAAGFVGSHLMRTSLAGEPIIGIDQRGLPGGNYPPHCDYRRADLHDDAAIERIVAEIEPTTIVHLAAMSHIAEAMAKGSTAIGINVQMTHAVLRAALALWRKGHQCRVIVAGSAAEYGDILPILQAPDETAQLRPIDTYGQSKAVSSSAALGYAYWFTIPVTVLRFGNIYGPGQGPDKFVPIVIDKALKGEKLRLNGKGLPSRMWVHVDDACDAIRWASRSRWHGVFNIAEAGEYTNRQVADMIHMHLQDLAPKHGLGPVVADLDLRDDGGGAMRVAMDVSRARTVLGWSPTIGLNEGLRHTVAAALKERTS